jgi:hypothetical protein
MSTHHKPSENEAIEKVINKDRRKSNKFSFKKCPTLQEHLVALDRYKNIEDDNRTSPISSSMRSNSLNGGPIGEKNESP